MYSLSYAVIVRLIPCLSSSSALVSHGLSCRMFRTYLADGTTGELTLCFVLASRAEDSCNRLPLSTNIAGDQLQPMQKLLPNTFRPPHGSRALLQHGCWEISGCHARKCRIEMRGAPSEVISPTGLTSVSAIDSSRTCFKPGMVSSCRIA
jgi:hypothetical protein